MQKNVGESPPDSELSAELVAELRTATELADDAINVGDSDASEATDWSGAVRGRFYRPATTQKILDIDVDVLAFFEAQGAGYQTQINRTLRASMLRARRRRGVAE